MKTIQEDDKVKHTSETKPYNSGEPFIVEKVDLVKELVKPVNAEEWIPLKEVVLVEKD